MRPFASFYEKFTQARYSTAGHSGECNSFASILADAGAYHGQLCVIETKQSTSPKLGKDFVEVLNALQLKSSLVIEPFPLSQRAMALPLSHVAEIFQSNQPQAPVIIALEAIKNEAYGEGRALCLRSFNNLEAINYEYKY